MVPRPLAASWEDGDGEEIYRRLGMRARGLGYRRINPTGHIAAADRSSLIGSQPRTSHEKGVNSVPETNPSDPPIMPEPILPDPGMPDPSQPPPTRPLPDLPDEPAPMPMPADPPTPQPGDPVKGDSDDYEESSIEPEAD
jgi:hypothetical protein